MTISRPPGLMLESIAETDPVLWEAMLGERRRQHDKIELIASENYVSAAVAPRSRRPIPSSGRRWSVSAAASTKRSS